MLNKKLSDKSRIRVIWEGRPEDYSKENKLKIKADVSEKYGVKKENVNVMFKPVKVLDNGQIEELKEAKLENILDRNYQITLFKKYLEVTESSVSIDDLLVIDNKISDKIISQDDEDRNQSWGLKKVWINNVLSFGKDNFVDYNSLNGINMVTSSPPNMGGKTTFAIDTPMFLLYGQTTKTSRLDEIFNTYTNENTLSVRGELSFEGLFSNNIIIERKLNRTAKKSGGWTIKSELKYQDVLPDGSLRDHSEEESIQTTKEITKRLGSIEDFKLLLMATSENLDDLIYLGGAESSKLLNRYIGLEVIQNKEVLAREEFNAFNRSLKSNVYDTPTLESEIAILENENENLQNDITKKESELAIQNSDKKLIEDKIDKLNSNRIKVDENLNNLSEEVIDKKLNTIKNDADKLILTIEEKTKKLSEYGEIIFDEKDLKKNSESIYDVKLKINNINNDINNKLNNIDTLINNEKCSLCGTKLDKLDNSDKIEEERKSVEELRTKLQSFENELEILLKEKEELDKLSKIYDEKNKVELDITLKNSDLKLLREKYKGLNKEKKNYLANKENIEKNKKIDSDLALEKTNLTVVKNKIDSLTRSIIENNSSIQNNKDSINGKNKLIEIIKEELIKVKQYKTYIDMVGKNGITKYILRSVIPIINSEIEHMIDDVCDFKVELNINDKNELEKNIIDGDIVKPLKSASGYEKTVASLAIRSVLGRISTLSKPNFIIFDEVFGKVADENIDSLKIIFDKIGEMYETVFIISHLDKIRDWADHVIQIEKVDRVSRIKIS